MRREMAVLSAFILGISSCAPEITTMAAQNEGKVMVTENLLEGEFDFLDLSLMSRLKDNNLFDIENLDYSKKDTVINDELLEDTEHEKSDMNHEKPEMNHGEDVVKTSEMKDLQVPQKLDIVIDPWGLDEKGQIYSEQYAIKNAGEMTGILTLSCLTCRPHGGSSVVIRTDKEGLHGNKEKSLYMEMLFGNGQQIVLSEDGAEFQTELKPGEELNFSFGGEVNEYIDGEWKNGDIEVGVVYSWETEELLDDNADDSFNTNGIEDTNELLEDPEIDKEEIPLLEEIVGAVCENEGNEDVGDKVRTINLSMIQKARMDINSWKITEDNNGSIIAYAEYVMQNTGDVPGILTLSELECTSGQNGFKEAIDREEVNSSTEQGVYIKVILENEEIVLSQEDSEYKVRLEPGENATVRFVREINENIAEALEVGIFEVSAICFWNSDGVKYD